MRGNILGVGKAVPTRPSVGGCPREGTVLGSEEGKVPWELDLRHKDSTLKFI
jgi:hypothetical protein